MKTYLELAEIKQLEEAGESLRDRLIIRMLSVLGCRVSELLELKMGDIDFQQGTVLILREKTRLRVSCPQCGARIARKHLFCPGCGSQVSEATSQEQSQTRRRVLHLEPGVLAMLKRWTVSKRLNPSDHLFEISRFQVWTILKECGQRAGLPRLVNPETGKEHWISPHRLRDAFAVMAVKKGSTLDDVRFLQEQLGHQSINTTMRYRKLSGEELKEWYHGLWESPSDLLPETLLDAQR